MTPPRMRAKLEPPNLRTYKHKCLPVLTRFCHSMCTHSHTKGNRTIVDLLAALHNDSASPCLRWLPLPAGLQPAYLMGMQKQIFRHTKRALFRLQMKLRDPDFAWFCYSHHGPLQRAHECFTTQPSYHQKPNSRTTAPTVTIPHLRATCRDSLREKPS